YHYGFDLVVAAVAAMTRLSVDLCIDVVTVVGFAYAATLAWHLGEVTIGRGAGRATAALMLLGGGVPLFVSEVPVSLHPFWHGIRAAIPVGGVWLSPPLPSYFLQHPWGLGIPLALALLLLLDQARIRRGAGGAFVLLTVALAASQLVLALTLTPAMALRALLRAPRERRLREVALWTLLVTGAGIGAWLSGGFFAKGPDGPSTLEWALGVTDSFESDLWWLGMSSGLVIPLGLIGLRRLDAPNRWLAASMIVGALTLVILLRVRGSWDIVKFLTVAMLMAGWAASAELDHLARRGTAQRYLAGVLGAGCIAWGSTFLLMLAVRPSGLDETFSASLELPSDDDLAAIDWLRRRLPARELVYRRRPFARSYAVWGGLSVAWIESETPAFAFGDERIRRRESLLAALPLATGPWLEEGIRWIVLDAEAEDLWLAASCERWIRAGLARERTRFGGLRVVEIVRAGDVGGPGPAVRRARD
ncbi:MAG: hypothetical protein KC731_19535, partial [Myxococcales bacterium]|nr:hypothetical protein [Myxococcales bacterium]